MSRSASASNDPSPSGTPGSLFRYRFANVEFDESNTTLRVAGEAVTVEPLPLQLLGELLRRPNEVVTRAELFEALWDGRPTVDHVLANAVAKLRRAVGEEAAARIVNLPRVGYRLSGPVERVAVGRRQAVEIELAAGQAVPGRDNLRLERPLGATEQRLVWLARDVKLQLTRVFKFATDGDRLASLKREYTVYRVLQHELGERRDFARVIGVNFAQAPYYLECEYGGEDLPHWAAADDRLAAMTVDERVTLFLQIARAVAAAHSVGVLHKDLKPANVLIDHDAEAGGWAARLTDFGISRLLEPGRLAQMGVTAMGLTMTHSPTADSGGGTPLYLAPELLAGQSPTMRSDVYALGLMLYQVLVGDFRRPMSTGWERDIEDELLREDIAAATEGKAEQRLASVAEFAERLARLPERRAQRADAQRHAAIAEAAIAEQTRRRARRPWLYATGASLVIGLVASLSFALAMRSALTEARAQADRANAINEFMAEDFVTGVGLARVGNGFNVAIPEVLRHASDRAARRFTQAPLTEAELHIQLGRTYYRLSMLGDARKQFERAVALLEPQNANPDTAPLLTMAQLKLAALLADQKDLPAAKTLMSQIARDPLADPTDPADPLARAFAQTRLKLATGAGQYKEALAPAQRLVELTNALPASEIEPRFSARYLQGSVLYRAGRLEEAEAAYLALLKPPFDAREVGDVQVARARINLSRVQLALEKYDTIEANLVAARDTLLRLVGPAEASVALANNELGNYFERRGEFAKAADAFRQAEEGYALGQGKDSAVARICRLNIAIMEAHLGRSAEALAKFEAGRPWFVKRGGGEQDEVVQSLDFYRAQALTSLGRASEALAVLEHLRTEKLTAAAPSKDWEWRLQAERGRALVRAGRPSEGADLVKVALANMDTAGTPAWIKSRYQQMLDDPRR